MNFRLSYKKLEEFAVVFFVIFSGFSMNALFKISNSFTFPNLDEMLWHMRSKIFWDKIFAFDFSGLIQSAQPGITVYWFTGFMMKFLNFDFSDVARRIAEKEAEGLDFNHVMNVNDQAVYAIYQPISFLFNFPLFLSTVIFFVLFYYLLRKLGFNKIISYFSLLFVTTNIFLFYWTTPSDKMLNIFISLSLLTFLVYVENTARKKYLVFSAIFGALAVLSKISALFLFPFYLFALIFYFWPVDFKKVKKIIKDYIIWAAIFVVVFAVFLPSLIFYPREVFDLIFNSKYVIEADYSFSGYAHRLVFDYVKLFFLVFTGYLSQGFFLSFMAYIILKIKKQYGATFKNLPEKHIKIMSFYMVFFLIMVTILSQNHDARFLAPVFTILSIVSAAGLYEASKLFIARFKIEEKFKKLLFISIFFLIVFSQAVSVVVGGSLAIEIIKTNAGKMF